MGKELDLLRALIVNGNIREAPKKMEFYTEHKVVTIGIGKDHTAQIIIDVESLLKLYELTGGTD